MNKLFVYAGAKDLAVQSSHAQLLEFWKLDAEIAHDLETIDYMQLYRSLEFNLKICRAKQIIKNLK